MLAPLRLDTPFKRAFRNTASLAALLNAVLNDTANHKVTSVNNVELKSTQLRSCIFDVYCTLSDGSKVIIELQKANMRDEIVDRLVGYVSRSYGKQWLPGGSTEAGSGSYMLVPVKIVAIVDFKLEKDEASCGSLVQNYSMCLRAGTAAPSPLRRLQELVDITIVQLPLAPTDASRPGLSAAELWAHLLRYSQKYSLATLPDALKGAPFGTVAASASAEGLTQEEREALAAEEMVLREALRLEQLVMRADDEKARADDAEARADDEKARADDEKARADDAEARAAKLEQQVRELLASQRQQGTEDADDNFGPQV